MEQPLTGGNTHATVVRVDGSVRRPAGPWTPSVHALLRHLDANGFDGAPRPHGLDEQGREVLDYVDGTVVHPDADELLAPDDALAEVARLVRAFHDAAAGFDADGLAWSDRARDPTGADEVPCHGDLGPWNLVRRPDGSWALIDWDLAAPGRRSWDVSLALVGFVPLFAWAGLPDADARRRIAVFRDAYGADRFPADALAVAVERCEAEAATILERGRAGEEPFARLLAEGHREAWSDAAERVRALAGA